MSDIERALKTIDRWSRHLDKLEPETVGDAVDIDMHQDDLEHLRGVVQAARAQGGEVVAWMNQRGEVVTDEQKRRLVDSQGIVGAATATNFKTPLCTRAQQGSVPEEYRQALQDAYDIIVSDANTPENYGSLCRIGHVMGQISAAPQPEGDGWVKCSERLPTEADADFEYRLWCWLPGRGDMKLLLLDQIIQSHLSGFPVQWMRTGLKRPQPPVEQEDKGDE